MGMSITSRAMLGALCLGAGLLAGCEHLATFSEGQLRTYHQSRWQAVAQAYGDRAADVEFDAGVRTPKLAGSKMDELYRDTIKARQVELAVWTDLLDECNLDVQFVAEMLNVLVSRDGVNIERLAPQIDNFVATHTDRRAAWLANRSATADAVEALNGRWDEIWPGHDLSFELARTARELKASKASPLTDLRSDALAHYYHNEYDRLAFVYLAYEPEAQPNPVTHVPEDCELLSSALGRLEAALLARSALDEAIERDVERVSEMTGMDMSVLPWDAIEIPRGRYARPRAQAAVARLKLLKYIDALLVLCLDVYLYDVALEWREVWPAHELETNIFAYAETPEAPQPITDPVTIRSFRQ